MMNGVKLTDDLDECPEGDMNYIADMLGTAFRDKLIATMGGMALKVPVNLKTLKDDHLIVRALGRVDADELVEVMGGASFYIPVATNTSGSKRDEVIALVGSGNTNNEIARHLGISERHVRRLRAKANLNGHHLAKRLGVAHHLVHTLIGKQSDFLPQAPQARRAFLTGG